MTALSFLRGVRDSAASKIPYSIHFTTLMTHLMPFLKKPATGVFFVLLPGLLAASFLNEAEARDPAPQAEAPYFRTEASRRMLRYDVPAGKTSRIAVQEDRIVSAVYDRALLSIQTNSQLGELYVQPHMAGEAAVYLSTESGNSISILLNAEDDMDPQTIILSKSPGAIPVGTDTRSPRMLAPMPAADYEAAVKRIIRQAVLNEETPDVMKRGACPKPSVSLQGAITALGMLKPRLTACWSSMGFNASVIRVTNTRLARQQIDESLLTRGTILATAIDRDELSLGASASLIFVEAGSGS